MTLSKFKTHLFLKLAFILPISGSKRWLLIRKAGVKFYFLPNTSPQIFFGERVVIDTVNPEGIEIGNSTTIATGAIILTHYIDTDQPAHGYSFIKGKVKIGIDCFIGANAIICNSVTIGDHSIVAAGSVVTKDIPPYEIWGGNPASFIKKRTPKTNN